MIYIQMLCGYVIEKWINILLEEGNWEQQLGPF